MSKTSVEEVLHVLGDKKDEMEILEAIKAMIGSRSGHTASTLAYAMYYILNAVEGDLCGAVERAKVQAEEYRVGRSASRRR